MSTEYFERETEDRAVGYITAAVLICILVWLLIWSVRDNYRAGDQVLAMRGELLEARGELEISERLVMQLARDNGYLQAENIRLNGLPAKVVYRCEPDRPMPAFAPEWHYR